MLTIHGMVLLCIAREPTIRLSEIATVVHAAPRYVFKCIEDLEDAGFIRRQKVGRRNSYTVCDLRPIGRGVSGTVGDLIRALM